MSRPADEAALRPVAGTEVVVRDTHAEIGDRRDDARLLPRVAPRRCLRAREREPVRRQPGRLQQLAAPISPSRPRSRRAWASSERTRPCAWSTATATATAVSISDPVAASASSPGAGVTGRRRARFTGPVPRPARRSPAHGGCSRPDRPLRDAVRTTRSAPPPADGARLGAGRSSTGPLRARLKRIADSGRLWRS